MKRPSSQRIPFPKSLFSKQLSLRARLVIGNMLITFIAITGMGYYVYYRAQETKEYLTSQLEQSIREKAEENLSTVVNEQATQLNTFFSSKSRDIRLIGSTVENLLQQESSLNKGLYWNAADVITRLPGGSWDNPNTEAVSIFIPANTELTAGLFSELNTLKLTDITVPALLEANPEIIAIYFGSALKETLYYPNIDLANIVPSDFDVTSRPWYVQAAPAQNTDGSVIWSDPYQDAALNGLVVTCSAPVVDTKGKFRGAVAMDIQLNIITGIVSNVVVGETGYAFLVDRENRLIAFPQAGYDDFATTPEELPLGEIIDNSRLTNMPEEFFEVLQKTRMGESGLTTLTLGGAERFVAYRPINEVGYSLVIMVPSKELLTAATIAHEQINQQTQNTIVLSIFLVVVILLAASITTLGMGNVLTAPLKILTGAAEKIASGNLDERVEIQSQDEVGILATTLNTMASSLRGLIHSLEQRVAERTVDLEIARQQSEKRASELQIIGEISSIITREQKIETLLPLITRLVSERFDFYHIGIFLVDETKQFAVLQAANSEGGQKMLARGHKLEVGTTGIVGYVTKNGEPRIALDVGTDAVFFNNPDLPATRSEMALPLITRGQTIGALDVQSDKSGAFTESDANTLSILADQIAAAIENARLFDQTQQALSEAQSLYSQYVRESWGTLAQEESLVGYHQSLTGGRKLTEPIDSDDIREAMNRGRLLVLHADGRNGDPAIVVPVKLRGQIIGALNIKAPSRDHQWSQDEINLAESISERLSLALENARLFEETTRRAERERLVSDITTKIRSTNDPQEMIKTAVMELQRALGATRVEIIPQKSSLSPDK